MSKYLSVVSPNLSQLVGGAPKVHEELRGQRKWMKEWRQVGRHLQAMEGEKGEREEEGEEGEGEEEGEEEEEGERGEEEEGEE
ncbi:hypothetical protein DEO72_LG10g2259 [Vigna unguiculata]|uniref:Uncharacterized protein n=1 Tax=Vigna unguiculata TaxID=3917 RepID=A0A4D6NBE2_VIGUN|nr:hypothetical protein DEO72_LG10g2259 [Vigna unguiculata]